MSLADALTKEALIVDGSSAWKLGKSTSTDSTIETATISTYERRGFRATTIIPTCSLEALDLLFSTPGNNQLYEPAITQETTIEDDIADRCRLVHTKFGQQGMVSARDFVTRHATRVVDRSFASAVEKLLINESGGGATAGASGKVFIFATKSVEDDRRIPQQPNCVRGMVYMHTFIGIPLLGAHDVSGVKLLYISCVDPKGSIPAFALEGGWAAESATKLARIRDLATLIENLMVNAKHVQRHHLLLTALSPVPTQPRESLLQSITARESLVMGSTRASAAHAGGPEECLAQPSFADAKVIPLPVPQKIQPTQQQATTEEEEETVASAADQLPQQRATLPPTQNNSRSTVRPAPSSRPISVREEIVTDTPLPPAVTPEAQPSISTLIRLHRSQTWAPSKTLENCLLEELTTNVFGGGVDRKVLRISSTFQCTIGTFSEFLADTSQVSKYDPAIDTFEVVSESPAGVVLYTSYKRQTRLVEPRDFCTVTARAELDRTDALAQGLGSCAGAFVQCSTNSKDRGAVKGLVRGIVHIFGYVALTESELALGGAATNTTGGGKSSSIQVFNILCVDPSGSIPKWLVDAASADSCKKLATIRRLCEERQKTIPGALPRRLSIRKSTSQPSAAAASSLPTKKKQHTDPNDQDTTQPTNSSPTADSLSASNSSMAFHSCVDEQEVMEQQEHLRDFYESEVQEVVEHLILLHRAHGWEVQKTVNDIRLETMTTSFCDKKAIKIACEFKCTLETFRTVISSVDYIRKYNTTLNELEALDSPPYGTVMYTSYKSNSKIIQPRDFCTLTAAKLLSEEEGSEAGLYTKGFHAAAFVVSSINSTDKPPQPDYVRGTVHAHGYIAVAVPPNASRIRVFNVSLVDPMGSIPAKLVDAAVTETVKQMDVLRNICEKVQQAGGPRVAVPSTIVPDRGSVSQSSATASSSSSASSEFPAVDEVPILRKLARVHTSNDWVDPRYFGKVQGMWSPSDIDPEVPVLKFATEIMCSLDAFARFVTTSDHLRKVDPELDVVKYLEGPPNATISYTSHSSQHKVLPSTDLVQLSVNKTFQGDEGSDLGLYTKGITSAAFIQNAVNWSIKDDNNKQGSSKLNRAVVQYLGFVAIATPATARRIRVFHYVSLGNVSALRCGGGGGAAQKPKDSVFVDIANRLTRMAVFCEQVQRDIDAAAMEPVEQRATSSSQHQEEATTDTTPTKQVINDESNVDSPQPAIAEQESGTQASTAAAAADADDTTLVVVSRNQLDIYARLIDLQRKKDWAMGKVVERCLLETTTVSYCSKKAVRISTEMHCSLRTFAAFLDDVSQVRVMDPNLDRFDITDRHSDGTVEIYTSYQQQTRFVAPRDFFTLTSRNLLEADEVVAQPLIASIVPVGHCAVIQNSKSIGGHLPPAGSNLVRGIVSVHGFFATAASLDATKIRVFNISCVDPSGSIPNWVIEAANAEACKKLALMRQLCEELQKNL